MLSYPVKLNPEGERAVMLQFPDVPEAVVVGASEGDALRKAVPVLEVILAGYLDEGRSLPQPSRIAGARTVATDKFSPGVSLEE
jgi:predicted RNase H-like HicB family nuclease